MQGIYILGRKAFEKIVGKIQNTCDQYFLLFPQFFLPFCYSAETIQPVTLLLKFIVTECNTMYKEVRHRDQEGCPQLIYSLPDNQNSVWSKLTAFADDKMNEIKD